jgi:hypothetical protein
MAVIAMYEHVSRKDAHKVVAAVRKSTKPKPSRGQGAFQAALATAVTLFALSVILLLSTSTFRLGS